MEKNKVPRHVAIIMDGNGRWAASRGLPRVQGHLKGAENVREVMKLIRDLGIHYLTLYAFSTENWKRSKEEVDALMSLLEAYLEENAEKMKEEKIRLIGMGRIEELPEKVSKKLKEVMEYTSRDYEYTLILALNYGGRAEIVDSTKKIAQKVLDKSLKVNDITEEVFREHMYLPDVPDPDVMIRTSGELRLSNFLLWELSYAEFFVTDTYWPDFGKEELNRMMEQYALRDRRFGGRK